jgi:hypothetical protein
MVNNKILIIENSLTEHLNDDKLKQIVLFSVKLI